jgi:glutamate synthase (NADPH/NADH) large chain
VGKGAQGGRIVILKGENSDSVRVGGGVGKGLAYGAQGGLFIIQGNADSRACTRLSGAHVVLGARIQNPLPESNVAMANHANLKGFAFEYMTAGRVVVLGDPGPWICSGMTGGVIYCYLDKEMGMTRRTLKARLAKGADVNIRKLNEDDIKDVNDLLLEYHKELLHSFQNEEARIVSRIMTHSSTSFAKIVSREEEALKN